MVILSLKLVKIASFKSGNAQNVNCEAGKIVKKQDLTSGASGV